MNGERKARGKRRYVGLDIHKHYCVIAAVDKEGQVVLHAVRVEHQDLEAWAKKNLQDSDHVVIESTTNAWHVYDLIAPLVERMVVANSFKVKQIANARVKTDVRDTLILARLLAANLVPTVWVPPQQVRELRQLLAQRREMVETHTQVVNRMHSVAHRHHLKHERGKRFNEKNTGWQQDKRLSGMEQFQLKLEMENRAYLEKQIERIGKEVAKLSHQKPWAESMTYLMQLPGFGVITAMTVLAAIGEIERFETAQQLASYSGLVPGLEQSGTKKRGKGITKEGRKELRWALVEVAQRAVKSDPYWKKRFETMQKRMHRNQAIVAIARQILEVVWNVLTQRQPYRHFSEERIAYKYLTWGWQMDEEARDGLTRQQFTRYYLMRLGIGQDLTRIALDPKHPRRIASEAEVLALRPELHRIE
ncbi:MAG: IS110 family transposase [Anaerolineales bacterium]|jgi:transposase|nr:IS110 family transposase [Anaerolineales bacterium]